MSWQYQQVTTQQTHENEKLVDSNEQTENPPTQS